MRLGARQIEGSKPDIESVLRELRASLAMALRHWLERNCTEIVQYKEAVGEVDCDRDVA